jgi:hypothetical protein
MVTRSERWGNVTRVRSGTMLLYSSSIFNLIYECYEECGEVTRCEDRVR